MKKILKIESKRLWHRGECGNAITGANPKMSGNVIIGDCTWLRGDCSELRGDCTWLRGDCSELYGDCSGLRGDCSGLEGDCTWLSGDCSELRGDCTWLSGDCSGIYGNCTGIKGNLDNCDITDEERENGVGIMELIEARDLAETNRNDRND